MGGCAGSQQDTVVIASEQFCGFHDKDGPQTLSAIQGPVTHGREQSRRTRHLLIKHRIVQELIQNCFDSAGLFRQVLLQIKRHDVLQAVFAVIVQGTIQL